MKLARGIELVVKQSFSVQVQVVLLLSWSALQRVSSGHVLLELSSAPQGGDADEDAKHYNDE